MTERLQKIISAAGVMSRRAAEEAIRAGRVSVNGTVAGLGDKADVSVDQILVDGKPLKQNERKVYIMLNKPRGYVTTMHDEKDRKNVTELVKDVGCRIYPVGRLDMYSEGLLLLTNDGAFANCVMHPSHEIGKTYFTWVKGADIGPAVEYLRGPMEIDGYITRPADVDIVEVYPDGACLSVTIHEGRNRQVRKMCQLAGLQVTKLLRVAEGALTLGQLKSGQWRYLTEAEVAGILSAQENKAYGV
ncbi:MAG: rRNA pseudouridine synthase [Oscillospiraceae bacterium]|nr:rRNA pseudouridine synthase [Oscillospiraceae bacterium]